jgi:hypothetical protein
MIFSTSFTGSAGQLLFALNCVWLNFSIIARFNLVALNERGDARVQPRVERRSSRRCIFDGIVQQGAAGMDTREEIKWCRGMEMGDLLKVLPCFKVY